MDKTMASLLGALGALVAATQAQAAIPSQSAQVLAASSYADLLRPIPNALETLKTLDAAPATVEDVQYYPYYYPPRPLPPYRYRRYYHHHHHRYHRRFFHHHNFHHHHGFHHRWR